MEIGLAIILAASCALAFVIFGRASERNRRFDDDIKKAPGRIAEGMKDDAWSKPEKKPAVQSREEEPQEPKDEFDFFAASDDKAALEAIAKSCEGLSLDRSVSAKFNIANTEATLVAFKSAVVRSMSGQINGEFVDSEATFTARLLKPSSQRFKIRPRMELDYEFDVESPWPDLALELVEGPWKPLLSKLCTSAPVEGIEVSFDALEFKVSAKGVYPTRESLQPFALLCTAMTRHLLRALTEQE